MMSNTRPSFPLRRIIVAALVIALAVIAIYGQTWHHDFVNYDDDVYVFKNPEITGGLTWHGVRWAFGFHAANWHPLTWISHMLDCEVFGLNAGGHHLVGAGLHAANAVILLALLTAMTGRFWPSAVVAALFAVHPLRVESVAWAAERKDVLSTFFGLLAIAAHLRFLRRRRPGPWLASLALFALSLAAKPMLVTLPLLLFLLEVWPLGRHARTLTAPAVSGSWRRSLLEKIPFAALSLGSGLLTLRAHTRNIPRMVEAGFGDRLGNALVSCVHYLGDLLWPVRLASLYPYPRSGVDVTAVAVAATVLVAVTLAVSRARNRPYLAVGWAWYLVALIPVSGIVQIGGHARADRYTYVPLIGVVVALAWLGREWWPRRAAGRRAAACALLLLMVAFGVVAHRQVETWRDSLTLLSYTTGVTRDNYVMLNNLGVTLLDAGRAREAAPVLEQAVGINPALCDASANLGNALYALQRHEDAVLSFKRAGACYLAEGHLPRNFTGLLTRLGRSLLYLRRPDEATQVFADLLRLSPGDPSGRIGLASAQALRARGDRGPATGDLPAGGIR